MPKSAMIRARMEPGLKNEAEEIFKSLGLNTTEAISLFYHQVKLKKGIPFEIRLPDHIKESPVADESKSALVQKARSMTPNQRLEAFLNHSYLVRQIQVSGIKKGRKKGAYRRAH